MHLYLLSVTAVSALSLMLPVTDTFGSNHDYPYLMPFDIGRKTINDPPQEQPSQQQIYEFAWDTFIALNWPYLAKNGVGQPGQRGQPDPKATPVSIFGQEAQCNGADVTVSPMVVWETYLPPSAVFIDNPDPDNYPVRWGSPDFLNLDNGLRTLVPKTYNAPYSKYFADGVNQPYTHANVPTGPVVDQKKNYLIYEVTLNQSYFNYIKKYRYFSAHEQKKAVRAFLEYAWENRQAPPADDETYFQPLPDGTESYIPLTDYAEQGLLEIKAAWKFLALDGENPDIPERYLRRCMEIPLPSGGTVTHLVGLVGFHIHRVTPFGHLPSTFEQVDNVAISPQLDDPTPLPSQPTLNPGSVTPCAAKTLDQTDIDLSECSTWSGEIASASYPNGYQVNGLSGQPGLIPPALLAGEPVPSKAERPAISVSRVTPIPPEVAVVNRQYQHEFRNSVLRYYQLIGAQNRSGSTADNPDPNVKPNPYLGPEIPNPDLGPGIPGPQFSNTSSLVNTTLESYTQAGWSCAGCHINAFPQGVEVFPPFERQFQELHVMSFLLQNAKPELKAP